jgi:hypothetical protein
VAGVLGLHLLARVLDALGELARFVFLARRVGAHVLTVAGSGVWRSIVSRFGRVMSACG